jgi:hypothetical protein
MRYQWSLTWILFILQMVTGVVIVSLGFMGAVPENIIFNYYFVIYEPFSLPLATGSGFLGIFVVLPIIMFFYSMILSWVICLFKNYRFKETQ